MGRRWISAMMVGGVEERGEGGEGVEFVVVGVADEL